MRKFACTCASLLIFSVLGLGAQIGSGPIEAGEVEIQAEAWSPLALAPAGSVSTIDAAQVEASGAANASDLVELLPGGLSIRNGPESAQAAPSLRGSKGSQVLVVIDGVRANDSQTGGFDLSLMPASAIERIEVLSGGAGAVYGADAVAGVIIITTKRARPGSLVLRAENTSYPTALSRGGASSLADGQSLSFDAGLAIGQGGISVGASAERATAKYPYGPSELRENADFFGGSGRLSANGPLAGGRATASFDASYRDTGTPGSLGWPSLENRQRNSSLGASLGWSNDALAGGSLSLELLAHGSWKRLYAIDPLSPNRYAQSTTGIELRDSLSLSDWLALGSGLSLSFEAADSTSFDSRPEGQPTRLSIGAYVEPTMLLGDRLKLVPAVRYDWNDSYTAGITAMLSAVWKASETLDLRFSGGRSYRAPTFLDLFVPFTDFGDGTSYRGNPDLKPESAWSGELGLDSRSKLLSWSASVFTRYVRDLIAYNGLAAGSMTNIGAALMPGAELKLHALVGRLSLDASYDFIYPLDLSGGKAIADNQRLKDISQDTAKASASLELGRFDAGLDSRYWSERVDSVSSAALPGVLVIDARLGLRLDERTSLSLVVANILDSRYMVVDGYPMPGLSIKTALSLKL